MHINYEPLKCNICTLYNRNRGTVTTDGKILWDCGEKMCRVEDCKYLCSGLMYGSDVEITIKDKTNGVITVGSNDMCNVQESCAQTPEFSATGKSDSTPLPEWC